MEYAFVLNRTAYQGHYSDSYCKGREIGSLISVEYVWKDPSLNRPLQMAQTGVLGAIIWAGFAYCGMLTFIWMVAPPPVKAWRKPIR